MLPFLIGAVTAASAAAQLVGTFKSQTGYNESAEGAGEQAQAQLRAERIRAKQMRLDFMRARREIVRQAIAARSTILAEASAKGALGDSSVQIGVGDVTTQETRGILENRQNKKLGNRLFEANLDYYRGGVKVAEGQGKTAVGGGITNIGNAIGESIGPISRLGSLFTGGQ